MQATHGGIGERIGVAAQEAIIGGVRQLDAAHAATWRVAQPRPVDARIAIGDRYRRPTLSANALHLQLSVGLAAGHLQAAADILPGVTTGGIR
jgi:hypothetical protein